MIQVLSYNGTLIPFDEYSESEIRELPRYDPSTITVKKGASHTNQQRKAVFVWCHKIAKAFSDAGIMHTVVLTSSFHVEVDWDKDSVYKDIWCEIQYLNVKTRSISDLEKKDMNKIIDQVNAHVLAPQGISIPFPRWEDLAT